jgi:hypothetical protein
VQFIILPEKHNIKKPFSLNLGKVLESIWRVMEPHCELGDQIGRLFTNWATYGGSLCFFERIKQPKIMVTFWATFCLGKFITFLTKFKTWFVVGILRF